MREIRQLEIQQLRLTAEAKRAEAASTRAQAEATRASLIAQGQWTRASEAAFQAAIAKARALENEGKIADITADKLRRLAQITREAGNSAEQSAAQQDRLAESLNRVAGATERVAGAGGGRGRGGGASPPESEGGGSTTRRATGLAISASSTLALREAAGTLSTADLELAKRAYEAAFANAAAFAHTGARTGLAREADRLRRLYEGLLEQQRREQQAAAPGVLAGVTASQPAPTPVNITLGGATRTINVASGQDASALQQLIQTLAAEQTRS